MSNKYTPRTTLRDATWRTYLVEVLAAFAILAFIFGALLS